MNINELRIGNIIKFFNQDGFEMKVSSIEKKNRYSNNYLIGCDNNTLGSDFEDIVPVPLTNDFLKKNGIIGKFIKKEDIKNINPIYTFVIAEKNDSFIFVINDFFRVEMKYVHQFQNFFFSLTGVELEDWID